MVISSLACRINAVLCKSSIVIIEAARATRAAASRVARRVVVAAAWAPGGGRGTFATHSVSSRSSCEGRHEGKCAASDSTYRMGTGSTAARAVKSGGIQSQREDEKRAPKFLVHFFAALIGAEHDSQHWLGRPLTSLKLPYGERVMRTTLSGRADSCERITYNY